MKDQQRKKQRVVERNNQDYISKLPYSLLCNILSSLKINEAVKTSVLSSNWRYIFTNPTNLIFDAQNMLVKDYPFPNICHLSKVLMFNIKMKRASTFVSNVNKYLSNVKNVQKIDKLKVCFTFRNKGYGCNDLEEWIRFAVERNVEEIDLCLLEDNHLSAPNPNDGSFYVFPCDTFDFNSTLKCLRLAHCVLAPLNSCNYGFSTLATLELFKVDLKSEEHIRILLSSCDNLESLSFSECYNMDYLKLEHSFCKKLKYLKVNLCRQLKGIMLKSNILETLEYVGSKVAFFFDAPNLKSFFGYVSENWLVCKLSTDLPQLENLLLECCCMGDVMTKRFPTFENLRHLEIIKVGIFRQDLSWIPVALNACPTITKLKLHLRTYFNIDEELTAYWPPRCLHKHLKEITITGIRGHSSEIAIAIYLLRNAISLEKMIVDPHPRIYLGNGKCVHSEVCENWSRIEKHKVEFFLKKEVGSLVELLIL
ncbi:putative F-box/LRR-repeat protein At5g54820 [Trifolium pratense]|uniref:putative F-box/LRR-repeat protein At5g54820 n=1 Tax=Trifolium pratense TaxID=57577 RepID=UPI001E69020B|nr:putative F-box/LRR-repeat protein At5g54820 [Trifolium pratense]